MVYWLKKQAIVSGSRNPIASVATWTIVGPSKIICIANMYKKFQHTPALFSFYPLSFLYSHCSLFSPLFTLTIGTLLPSPPSSFQPIGHTCEFDYLDMQMIRWIFFFTICSLCCSSELVIVAAQFHLYVYMMHIHMKSEAHFWRVRRQNREQNLLYNK